MPDSPTIVSAALSDKELQDSINKMVANFDKGLQDMLDHSNKYVEKIQESLQKIGNTNFGAKGSNDGGVAKQTKEQKEATNEAEKRVKKEKEINLTLDQRAEIMGRIPREMRMPDMAKSARESFQAFYKGFNEQARKLDSLIKAEDNRLASAGLGRFSAETQAQLAKVDASIDQTRWKMNFLYQEEKRLNQEALRQKVGSVGFEQAWLKKDETKSARVREGERLIELEKERQRIIASDPTVQQLDRNIEQTRAKIQQLLADEKRLHSESLKQTVGSSEFERLWNQKYQARDQRIAEQEKLIQLEKERQSLVAVDPIRTQLANMDELRAKHEKVLGVMRDETTTNNKVAESQQQVISSTQQTAQAAQRYTEEIRKQAQAIRSSKEWQEKGWIVIGDNRFYDPERANVSKRDKQMLLSLEDQILQKENERIAAQERQNRESQREVEIKSQLPKQGFLFTNDDVISNKVNNERAARYKQLQEEEKYVNSRNAAIAKALHIGQEEIKDYDRRTASAKELNAMLKQQQEAYSRLSTAQRSQRGGVELLGSIQDTQRALQRLQLQMSRPISLKAALAGSEATLDDVAYKIRRLQAYMQGLDATNERSAAEIKKVAFNIELLKQKQNDLLNKNSQLIGSNNSLIKSNTALGRSWNYMKNRLAFYFTVGASTQFVKNLIEIRSQYEMTERALGILVNSAERGTQIFNELSQMALVSPYTLIELSGAAKQLVAYDVAAKDVVDTTRRLADMASAVGVPMERLTYALGQIKAYGYLNSRDNRMFANAGIPLVKQLADYYTELEGKLVSTADVYDRIKKKAVGYADVMQVITKMTDEGGKFFDFQEKMSGTLKVQIANLTLAWNNMLNEIGASEQGILTTGIAALKNLFLAWKDLSNILTTIAAIFGIVKAQQILSNIAIGKSTVSLIGYINANKEATWVEYSRALQTKKLTATQAAWLLMTNKNNAALAASLVRLKIIDAATARYLTTMKGLSAGLLQLRIMGTMALSGLAKGVKALGAAFMTNLPLVALTAAIDLFTHFSSVASNNKSFNESIATGANEASEALRNFMKEEDKVQARAKAASGNLSDTEAKKVWEAIREQIELSSQAANVFIPQLLSITNINERVTAAFNLADKIQEATKKLGELRDEMEVSQDSWLWGLFGEGIGEDLDDYNKRVKELREQAKYFAEGETSVWEDLKIAINGVWDGIGGGSGSQSAKEAVREIEKFANNAADVIKEKLGKEGVLDEKQVTEAVARFVKATEQQIPEIRGAGKKLFEALTNDIMGKQFEVFNAQEYYYSAFLEQLKKDYGSKFADITEDIKDKTVVWSDAQKKAIKETADKVKKDWPQASRDAIDEILKDLNNTEFKLHLVTTFSSDLTDFQQQFNTRANKLGMIIADTLQKFAPQSGDDLPSWTKKQQESIKALREENKNYEKDNSKWAKQRIAANNTEIEGRTKALSLFKQSAISDKDAAKNKKQAESELQKALKDELSTIDKVRSIYKDLTKEGMSHANAVERATRGWNETVNAINKVLTKNGLQKLDLSKFAGIENPRELVNMLQSQLNTLLKRGAKPAEIKELQTKVNTLEVDADKYDLTKITKGLNNELGKLKDEYELAVELDADPELGNAFADMMGINAESLPHTVKEYADEYSKYLNKYLKGKDSSLQFTGDELRGLTRDDITAFREQVDAGSFNQEWFDAIKKAYDDISGKRKKDLEETKKWKNSLIEKYGNLQDKLTKIYKDSIQNQVNAVKTFSKDEGQKSDIVRLQLRLEETDNPAELTEINTEIAKIVKDVTDKNPIALKLVTASGNQTKVDTSKAYWEDFKNSELYTMTFEDMANNSTRAIQLIIDKLNNLKNDVKEDPASMKALIKSLEDAEKELNTRDPFGGIARSLKNMEEASKETKTAQEALWRAEVDVEQAQQEYDNAEDGTPDERAEAQKKLAGAIQKRAQAEANLTQAESKSKKAQENLKSSLQGVTNQLGDVKSLFDTVSKLFRAGGDDDTADAIDAISEGFSVMTTVIMGVVAAMVILKSSQPWLLAIAAALSVVVGLVSFLNGQKNKKIDEEIKDSELAVKRLENAYKELQAAVEEAYGTMKYGAEQAAIANKKMQLEEKKRQLQLEKSRSSKDYDKDKIETLKGEIIDLEQEIKKATKDIINDMLGITSVGDAAEQMVSSMIDAFRSGEDYMTEYSNSFEDMIDNMIMKSIVSRVIGKKLEELWNSIEANAEKRGATSKAEIERQQKAASDYDSAIEYYENLLDVKDYNPLADVHMSREEIVAMIEKYKKEREKALANLSAAEQSYSDAIAPTPADVEGIRNAVDGMKSDVKEDFDAWMEAFGISFGDRGDKNLSNLQQGIQGITEDTAGALEAITNGISQQSYLQSDLLTQIRDAVVGIDIDVQVATQAQMLLQLQQSYAVQMAIQGILEGVLNPSGRAFSVELVS